jgi:hypothetical protein
MNDNVKSPIPDEIMYGRKEAIPGNSAVHTAPTTVPTNPRTMSIIEDLLMLGHLSKSVTIGKFRFQLRTLTNEEKMTAYGSVPKLADNTVESASGLRDELLVWAIESVNGTPLEHFYSGNQVDLSVREKRLAVIKKLATPVLDKLFLLYSGLEDEVAKTIEKVSFDDVKNS